MKYLLNKIYTYEIREISYSPFNVLFSLLAAQKIVSGTVLDSSGQPLPGANIIEVGTSNGVARLRWKLQYHS